MRKRRRSPPEQHNSTDRAARYEAGQFFESFVQIHTGHLQQKTLYECVVYNLSLCTIKQYIHPSRYKIDEIFPIKYRKDTLRNTKRVQMNINFTPLCE